jgi:hypothetical protein
MEHERERVRGREAELEKRRSMRERNIKEHVDVRKHCITIVTCVKKYTCNQLF